MFLPSILEYSLESLYQKLELLLQNEPVYRQISDNPTLDTIFLHLDFVLPQFARDNAVMSSLQLATVFDALQTKLENKKIHTSIHVMGSTEDLIAAYGFFQNYVLNPNWKYTVFVPEKYMFVWQNANFNSKNQNFTTGVWYDLGQWQKTDFNYAQDYLLMTVKAGKSGQKLEHESAVAALKICNANPDKNFILDGGWSIETTDIPENCKIVSYSSFWKSFLT